MKLTVQKGELTLPENFSFEIEQNSAFFSSDGAASVAATIPATPADQEKLGFPTRTARRYRFANLYPATIESGAFRKNGVLIVTSATRDAITCAVALEDSEFYSQHKDTPLKQLFAQRVLTTYSTPDAWYDYFFSIYSGATASTVFRLIPVAVGEAGDYQVNNRPVIPSSVSSDTIFALEKDVRIVKEGDADVSVPQGYGIAPFLQLSAFLETMFELCGYTVQSNCFRTNADLQQLILLHNCSDVLCLGQVDFSDLVPGCTVKDILEWIRQKFHAQIVVNPTTATVDILLLEDIITAGYDLDLTGRLLDGITHTFNRSSRVILRPDTSLEGAAPAAETMEDLLKKYGAATEIAETSGDDDMGLVLRRATGDYYEQGPFIGSRRVGSNYFTYDRRNSDESEEQSWSDLTPPMVFVGGVLMPYIGGRKHRNSSYNGSTRDEDQDIIIVSYAGRSAAVTISGSGVSGGNPRRLTPQETVAGHYFYGTTQKYDNTGALRSGGYNLNGPEIFERFFARYNKMLRNNLIKVEGRFDLTAAEILQYNLYSTKLFRGQLLLPVALQYEVGRSVRCLKAAFYICKDYEDGVDDTPTVIPAPSFHWVLDESEVTAFRASVQAAHPSLTIITKYSDEAPQIFLPAPTAAGQSSAPIARTVLAGYNQQAEHNGRYTFITVETATVNIYFTSAAN
ncbi:MAG: hypothetical protein IKN60_04815 [Bacteroidales bacterium]|nr:hypothetical protein [Bacteroidales bacterium]